MLAMALSSTAAIRTDFEGGSIGRVDQVAPGHYRCAIRGEVDQDGRNRQASWYYFALDDPAGSEVTIALTDLPGEYNYVKGNLAINGATRPFISYDRRTWTPLPASAVEWDEAETSLRFRFALERSPVWVAHVPPYVNSHLDALLDDLKISRWVQREEIGKTAGRRSLILLNITNPAVPASRKKVIWIMARQHAWETGTSWVIDGAVRFLAGDSAEAAHLRDRVLFKFFPMADPDGVARGGVRFNAYGYDVNRNWDVTDPAHMPEITALRQAIFAWVDSGHRLDLFFVLHNDNSGSLTAPLSLGGPGFRDAIGRLAAVLEKETVFSPRVPRDWEPAKPARGRADACQEVFRERGIPAALLEQNVQTLPKLGRPAGAEDYSRFGRQLLTALANAVDGRTASGARPSSGKRP
jgi:hypothetical protein